MTHRIAVTMKDGTIRDMVMPHEQGVPAKLAAGLIAAPPDWYVAKVQAEFDKWTDGSEVVSWEHVQKGEG